MKLYYPKPGPRPAIQWTGENLEEITDFCGPALMAVAYGGTPHVRALDGRIEVSRESWLHRAPDESQDTVGIVTPLRFAMEYGETDYREQLADRLMEMADEYGRQLNAAGYEEGAHIRGIVQGLRMASCEVRGNHPEEGESP